MNRAIRRLSLATLVLFVVLMLNVNYLQVFRVNSLASEAGNVRVFDQQFHNQRGEIVAAGGPKQVVVAESRLIKGGIYQRYYPHSYVYAPITGYDSIYGSTSAFGTTGIERAENNLLAGTASSLTVHNLIGLITGKSRQGATVYLTINPGAQQAAYAALAAMGKPAAAVAIDPRTGAILALASYPTFNPNDYATLDSRKLAKIDARYRRATSQPLLNRAINDTFPPGSTFKIITSSTAFSTGKVASENATIPAPTVYILPGTHTPLTNDNGAPCGDGHPQIIFAFTVSCNTAFGKLGDTVGGTALHKYANLFGFNNPDLAIPLPVSPSNYPPLTDPAQIAQSAIGQFSDTVTPLQEAMMAAAMADGGTMMRPYLVSEVQAPDLSVISRTQPAVLQQVVTPQVAAYVRTMMLSVTHNPAGTAYFTAGPPATGIQIAGKTGTAQNGHNNSGLNDAVFTCFAPYSSPTIAVGVIVKGGGFGAAAAAPIALAIIRAYLGIAH
jgi:peptidoglycan glycosyltransferase